VATLSTFRPVDDLQDARGDRDDEEAVYHDVHAREMKLRCLFTIRLPLSLVSENWRGASLHLCHSQLYASTPSFEWGANLHRRTHNLAMTPSSSLPDLFK
jgi:hypothetical protein